MYIDILHKAVSDVVAFKLIVLQISPLLCKSLQNSNAKSFNKVVDKAVDHSDRK